MKNFLFILVLTAVAVQYSTYKYNNSKGITNSTMDNEVTSIQVEPSDDIQDKEVPTPIPFMGWVFLGIIGAVSFGMMLNDRGFGFIVWVIFVYYVAQNFLIAKESDYQTWPFLVLTLWILLTGGLAKRANAETLEKHPGLK